MTMEDVFAQGLCHLEAGRPREARRLFGRVLARDPDHAESFHLLGLIAARDGDPRAAVAMIQRAMTLAPGRAPHHNSLALAWSLLGRTEAAVHEYRVAVSLRPEAAELHNNLAAELLGLGRIAEAVAHYRRAVARAPRNATIWCNLAKALAHRPIPVESDDCFRRALSLEPDNATLSAAYGQWLLTQARWREAEGHLMAAIVAGGGNAAVWTNLGAARYEDGRAADAEAAYRYALILDPNFADAHYNHGCLAHIDGRTDEAVACHRAAVDADPSHGAARLAVCMAQLPILYRSGPEIDERRDRYLHELQELEKTTHDSAVRRALAAAIGSSWPFFLPYQGRDDREAQSALGRMACRILAETETPVLPPRRRARRERVRVGIVSGFFRDHTIFKLFLEGWLTHLDRDRFEVISFHTGRISDAATSRATALSDHFVHDLPVAEWPAAVAGMAPHILLYPEFGIDPIAGGLAARRLAAVQCVAWGHPNTTGMPTIDHFLTADLMEPPDAGNLYTENLVRLPGLGVYYVPNEPSVSSGTDQSGLPGAGPVYWSGQALYKYSPAFDWIYPRIAANVGECRFVFVGFAKSAAVTEMFRQRLDAAFAGQGLRADRYCVVLPPMGQADYVAAAGAADAILDTPGWSGGKSTFDCLERNPAMVTLPGRFMRGRHTAAILRHIGCESTIASSLDEYVSIAVRLGLDADWRKYVRNDVASNKHRAFRNLAPIRALENFLTHTAQVAEVASPLGRICRG